jgi:hypothetical protein
MLCETTIRLKLLMSNHLTHVIAGHCIRQIASWNWSITVPGDTTPGAPLIQYTVTIIRDTPRRATCSDASPAPDGAHRGVEVVVSELYKQWELEDSEAARNELAAVVALYLTD